MSMVKEMDLQKKHDYELFLQAFEKPTQIYRYLRMRNLMSPIFLQRNLAYLKDRMSQRKRLHRRRQTKNRFDLNVFHRNGMKNGFSYESRQQLFPFGCSCLTLKFIGLFDANASDAVDSVQVDLYLSARNKYDSRNLLFSVPVKINPIQSVDNITTVSIPMDSLKRCISRNQTCLLMMQISKVEYKRIKVQNADDKNVKQEQPHVAKRTTKNFKAELVVFDKSGQCNLLDGEYELKLSDSTECNGVETATGTASNHNHQYHHVQSSDRLSWTDIPEHFDHSNNFFRKNPSLKFVLLWSNNNTDAEISSGSPSGSPISSIFDRKLSSTENAFPTNTINNNNDLDFSMNSKVSSSSSISSGISIDMQIDDIEMKPVFNADSAVDDQTDRNTNTHSSDSGDRSPMMLPLNEAGTRIIYRFIYNNDLSQQTETCENFMCPWCHLDCLRLFALLKHLRLCHDRFKFAYTQTSNGIRIDVAINEQFNCSLANDMQQRVTGSFATGARHPQRRFVQTKVLVYRPHRNKANQRNQTNEFNGMRNGNENDYNDDGNSNHAERVCTTINTIDDPGYNRQYYRSTSNLPAYRNDIDEDSEGEHDTGWLRKHTQILIDEFSDVNEGEKEIMKMWNQHVMKHNFIGMAQMPLACEMFLDAHGLEVLRKNLYRNFVLHLCNLFDNGMLSADEFLLITQKLQARRATH